MEIRKVYKEAIPQVKLIGKRYTNKDRDQTGSFAAYWQQWFREGWFNKLAEAPGVSGVEADYLGAMRMTGSDPDSFEYWIGLFRDVDAVVPEGFEAVIIPAGELGICWLYGNDQSGELYSMEASDMSMAALTEQGYHFLDSGWFLERYNCPRFTTPDEKGKVILDICAYLV